MGSIVRQISQYYLIPFLMAIVFLILLRMNRSVISAISKRFSLAAISILLLTLSDAAQYFFASLPEPSGWRMLAAACSYTIRVSIIYYILMIFRRHRTNLNRWIMTLPLILTAISAFSAFFTKLSFYYTENNEIVRGPLIIVPFIASFFYFFILVIEVRKTVSLGNGFENKFIIVCFLVAGLTTYMEVAGKFYGMIAGTAIISVFGYFFFFLSDSYTHDTLTGVYTRERLRSDASNMQGSFGVISMDVNFLKIINDTKGHAAGDLAIKTIAETLSSLLKKNSRLYRMGGDEFIVLIKTDSVDEVMTLKECLREGVKKTEYTVAFGSVLSLPYETVDAAISRADKLMYIDKRTSKEKPVIEISK